jgi:DNA repair exonuclease SbcCD ATPase subunit
VIESILLVAAGFLGAILLALLAAPVLWRRAVALTRRRVEASIPISKSEIQADKDRLRADFAMSARRLEMNAEQLKDRTIAQRIEIDRLRDRIRELTADHAVGQERIAALAAESGESEAELRRRIEELEPVPERLAAVQERLDEKSRELEEMNQMYEEASYASSTRQIELVARESEIDRLSDELSGLRTERKEAERRMREAEAAKKAGEDALEGERRRAEELDAKLSRLMTTVSDREEKLERREKEMARLQQEATSQTERADELARKLEAEQTAKAGLEDALDRSAAEIATLERHEKEVVRLQRDLLAQTKRADGLAAQLAARPEADGKPAVERAGTAPLDDETRASDELLRDQINELAAQVVQLTALVDGPESPLRQQFANGKGANGGNDANGMSVTSIADRVRALQKAAASSVN